MLLAGPPGSGKSMTATWALRTVFLAGEAIFDDELGRACWHAATAWFTTAADLYEAVFDKDRPTIARARLVDVLVVDDWGAAYEHEWPLAELDRLIDRRWGERLPTIVTTNTHTKQFPKLYPRAWSRLTDASGVGLIAIDRPDQRSNRR